MNKNLYSPLGKQGPVISTSSDADGRSIEWLKPFEMKDKAWFSKTTPHKKRQLLEWELLCLDKENLWTKRFLGTLREGFLWHYAYTNR